MQRRNRPSDLANAVQQMGLCQNECFDVAPLRCVRISKMQGIEDEGYRSLLE